MVDIGTILLEGLIVGLTVGTSCLITCLPILVAHIAADHPGFKGGVISSISFSAGRLIAYFLYALIFGLTGLLIEEFIQESTLFIIIFSIIMVTFLVIYGLSLAIGEDYFPSLSKKVCNFTTKYRSSFVLGILIGLVPCGPLFYIFGQAVLLGAENLLFSFLFFLIFWCGTTVYIFIAGVTIGGGAAYIHRHEKIERIRRICGFILIILAIFHLFQILLLFQ
ncbi:MAG TPA: sulfite exporter TauE/SafE family protein [Candidatus Deferrimicrobium sp.]|nr:sulfite exporter TauE/SafE family protein [Candidatus Deferrimicrobium sp.]